MDRVFPFFFTLVFVAASFACGTAKPLQNPQKTMVIKIDSDPPAADVYTYENGRLGSRLGTTPFEIVVGARVDFDGRNHSVWFDSPGDCVKAQKMASGDGAEYRLTLNCALIKEGYNPEYVLDHFVTVCSVRYGIKFENQNVSLAFRLDEE